MKNISFISRRFLTPPPLFAGMFAVGLILYAYVVMSSLSSELARVKKELEATNVSLSAVRYDLSQTVVALEEKTTILSDTLLSAEKEISTTKENIAAVQTKVGGVESAVGTISGTVTNLEKLSKIDSELLQKYSKVFFLNEHYVPERVVEIQKEYLYIERNPELIHAQVWPRLKALIDSAKKDGVTVYVKSAYRSFDEQSAIHGIYTVTYGAGTANQFSADQGYSEHQLGTTVDFITTGLGGELDGFDATPAYKWMLANAHKYGFTLSYPQGNSYYIFEPWHWRYVGVALATDLFNQKKHFYDLDQRVIDEYLINLFD